MKPVWLLCYQRTGTHLLTSCLNQTGLFDPPFEEWLNLYQTTLPIPKWQPWYNRFLGLEDYLKTLPPFCNVHRDHFGYFFKDEHKPLIENHLPGLRYIRLRRRDHIAVAVSIYIARETVTWTLDSPKEIKAHKKKLFKINKQKLYQIYLNHLELYNCWNEYLEGEDYLDLDYEDLMDGGIQKTFDYLEINQKPHKPAFYPNDHPMKQVLYELLEEAVDTGMIEYARVIPQPVPLIPLM